jgi:superfamily II DNA or RNA helicase
LWAVELTARGAMVPQLRRRARRGSGGRSASGSYSVRWTPALVDPSRLAHMAETMPGSVTALDRRVDRRALTRSALTGMVDAICRKAASGIEVAAPPPHVRTATDVAEAFLGRLDGSAFEAPTRVADDVVGKVELWARAVTSAQPRLIVQLDPPDESNAWHLAVLAPGSNNKPVPVERAIVMAGGNGPQIESELTRLERMVPALARLGGHRRGEVIVGADEAWELMATLGPRLAAAGFDVRVPEMSKKRATPMLRLFSESKESSVGANQLADVRWSALFDDVELTAADIARLAREARPLIHSGGRWVAIERADLQAAAEALAERENKTKMTGAEMLRLSLGLGDVPLAGVAIAGSGWAADLLAAVKQVSSESADAPDGFVGALRSYQSEALAWLEFLDEAGLGGCLALDMGLGKTPTMLAHLLAGSGDGPALVVAPPAVVGNWKAEAERFTPDLRVVVHHGTNRATAKELAREVKKADVILTTYGTAVRDINALGKVDWSRVVLDEAQAIKNPASDTAQQLRVLKARSKVALTGTPIENGLGDLWAILDFTNPGLVGTRPEFIASMSKDHSSARVQAEDAMHALNGILVFRRTKAEPEIAAELPDQIDEIDHCAMTKEQIGLYQALINTLVTAPGDTDEEKRKGQVLAAITGLKQICNHPWNYDRDDKPLEGRSGKLARLEEIVESVFAAGEKVLIFTHFAEWGIKLAGYLTERTGTPVDCYHGGLARGARDRMIDEFQSAEGAGALVLSLKAGGTGLNLTAANHVVLYDRWWNPAVEDQARDRAWRIGQTRTVICHRLICPGTVDERVEEVVAGKRHIADVVLPKSSSLADLDSAQLQRALGIRTDELLTEDDS